MKQQVIDLWKESFNDSDEFIDLFFSRVYQEKNTLTISKNGRVIAALQVIPYEMTYCGTNVPVGYICGVCISPAERGKGWMGKLMQQAIDEMNRRNYALTTLIPASDWLFDYYTRFGYTTIFDYSEEIHTASVRKENHSLQFAPLSERSFDHFYDYYNRIQQKKNCTILHAAYDLETIWKDCYLDKGNIWIISDHDQIVGSALAVPDNDTSIFIKEIMYENTEIKTILIQSILNHFQKQTATVRVPPTLMNSVPYGMAQILNKKLMMGLYSSFHKKNINILDCLQTIEQTKQLLLYKERKAFMNLMLD